MFDEDSDDDSDEEYDEGDDGGAGGVEESVANVLRKVPVSSMTRSRHQKVRSMDKNRLRLTYGYS